MENLKYCYLDMTDIIDPKVKNLIGNCEKIIEYQRETKKDDSVNEGMEIRPSKGLPRKAPAESQNPGKQTGEYISSESEFDFKEFTEATSEDSLAKRRKQNNDLVNQFFSTDIKKTDEEKKAKDKTSDLDKKIIASISEQKLKKKPKENQTVANDRPTIEVTIRVEPIQEEQDLSSESDMTLKSESFYIEDKAQNSDGKIVKDIVRISKPKKVPKSQANQSAKKNQKAAPQNILSELEDALLGEEEESFYVQAELQDAKELKDLSESNVLPFSSLIQTGPSKQTPVFVRKLRELNPQQKVEKKAKEMLNLGQHEEYDDDEVIIQKQLVPTDEWADGKKVYQKLITREPIDEVDLNVIDNKPLSYYVSLDPDQLARIKKTPEQLKLERKQLNESNPVLHRAAIPQVYEKKDGKFKEYEPKVKPKNSRYVILKDSGTSQPFVENVAKYLKANQPQLGALFENFQVPGIAVIRLGEKSQANPIIRGLKNSQQKSIPILVQQKGQINGMPILKKQNFEKLDASDPKNVQLSVNTLKSLKRNPFESCVTNKDLRKILNTLNPSTTVRFYHETGDEVDATRVVVPVKLEEVKQAISGLDQPVAERLAVQESKIEIPEKYETIYDVYGIDPKSGTAVYNQIVRLPGEGNDGDQDSIRQIQILDSEEEEDDQNYPQEVNIDQTSEQDPFSRVSRPIVDRLHYRSGSPDDRTLFNDEDIQEMKILDMFGNTGDEYEYQMFDPEIQVEDSAIVIYEHPHFEKLQKSAQQDNIRNLASRSPQRQRDQPESRSRSPAFFAKSRSPNSRQINNRKDPLEDFHRSQKFPIIDKYIQDSASRRMDSVPQMEYAPRNAKIYRSQQIKDASPTPKAFETNKVPELDLKTPERQTTNKGY